MQAYPQNVRETGRDESQSVPPQKNSSKQGIWSSQFLGELSQVCSPHSPGYTRTYVHLHFPVAKTGPHSSELATFLECEKGMPCRTRSCKRYWMILLKVVCALGAVQPYCSRTMVVMPFSKAWRLYPSGHMPCI